MMKTLTVALIVLSFAVPASAQNKREMQMMADIRMLQEQNQQLQVELHAAIAALSETLKAINARVDEQASATRKAFADQGLKLDQFASEQRVVREGVSENNVRIGQLSQEVEAVRLSIPQFPPPPTVPTDPSVDPTTAATPGTTAAAPPAPPRPVGPGITPQRLFNTAQLDYYSAQWDLCVRGFETYLQTFPKSELAHEAQFYIGECQFQDGKWQDAIAAYNQVIATYPRSGSAAMSYYKRGQALEKVQQFDRARESYEGVIKNFPDSDAARLAKQNLDRLNRGRPPK